MYKIEHIQSQNSHLEWLDLVVIPIFVNTKDIRKQSYIVGLLDSQRGAITKWGETKTWLKQYEAESS